MSISSILAPVLNFVLFLAYLISGLAPLLANAPFGIFALGSDNWHWVSSSIFGGDISHKTVFIEGLPRINDATASSGSSRPGPYDDVERRDRAPKGRGKGRGRRRPVP